MNVYFNYMMAGGSLPEDETDTFYIERTSNSANGKPPALHYQVLSNIQRSILRPYCGAS